MAGGMGGSCYREGEPEGGALVQIVFCPDRSAMTLDDRLCNRQAEAHAVSFRGEEGLEHPRQVSLIDSVPTIHHGDGDVFAVGTCIDRDDL